MFRIILIFQWRKSWFFFDIHFIVLDLTQMLPPPYQISVDVHNILNRNIFPILQPYVVKMIDNWRSCSSFWQYHSKWDQVYENKKNFYLVWVIFKKYMNNFLMNGGMTGGLMGFKKLEEGNAIFHLSSIIQKPLIIVFLFRKRSFYN